MKVTLFGHFGTDNTGNESTLLTTISRLQALRPDMEILCVCSRPEIVAARYGIPTVPISTKRARETTANRLLIRRLSAAAGGALAELAQYLRAFRVLKGQDAFVVPGTGLVTDAYTLSEWGPYSQFKWTLAAKLRGAKVMYMSVGAGPFYSRRGRIFARAALSLADYRSYRDAASRESMKAIGFNAAADPVYPDLVFGLPEVLASPSIVVAPRGRRTVGLGLMEYPGRYSAANPPTGGYQRYMDALATLTEWLLDHDYDIRLLLGDSDTESIDDLRAAVRTRLPHHDESRLIAEPISSVQDVVAQIDATDVTVVTRFHNTLLSLLLGKPVLAISFHHKCASLMAEMGLADYCINIHQIDGAELITRFQMLEHDRVAVTGQAAKHVGAARAQVEEQYELLFTDPVNPGTASPTAELSRPPERWRQLFLAANKRAWDRLPATARERKLARRYGMLLNQVVRGSAVREMYRGTHFMRNRPSLELTRRLIERQDPKAAARIAVLGCSIGVEVYSILWTLRSTATHSVVIDAVDIAPDVVAIGERGLYGPRESEVAHWPIFSGLTDAERAAMFDWAGDEGRVKAFLREGITWHVGDASDRNLIPALGPQDLVVANNFLCHLDARSAERCLRNIAGLVRPGGHLIVTGIDLDVRAKVARDLGWVPVAELRAEIHDGDPLVRADWPWHWWGLEPFDHDRADWELRYSAAFRLGAAI